MESIWIKLLIICPLVFLGALVDAIAGGGGLITLPAYLIAGVPPQNAAATNKLSSSFGTVASATRYIKSGVVDFKAALPAAFCALIGSALGARLLLFTDERILQILLMVMLPVMAFLLMRSKGLDMERDSGQPVTGTKAVLLSGVIGLTIGAYDGFFGPGTGTFLTLAFVFVTRLELRTAMGNSKIVNLASNVAALVTFLLGGRVLFVLGIPAAVSAVAGGYVGSGLALKNGAKIFKPAFLLVFALLLVRVVTELFS